MPALPQAIEMEANRCIDLSLPFWDGLSLIVGFSF